MCVFSHFYHHVCANFANYILTFTKKKFLCTQRHFFFYKNNEICRICQAYSTFLVFPQMQKHPNKCAALQTFGMPQDKTTQGRPMVAPTCAQPLTKSLNYTLSFYGATNLSNAYKYSQITKSLLLQVDGCASPTVPIIMKPTFDMEPNYFHPDIRYRAYKKVRRVRYASNFTLFLLFTELRSKPFLLHRHGVRSSCRLPCSRPFVPFLLLVLQIWEHKR